MLTSQNISRFSLSLLLPLFLWCAATTERTSAQSLAAETAPASSERSSSANLKAADLETGRSARKSTASSAANEKPPSNEERLNALEQTLQQQNAKLDELQKMIVEQQQTIQLLAGKLGGSQGTSASASVLASAPLEPPAVPSPQGKDPLKDLEGRVSKIEAIKFEGDIRLRGESFFGLTNSLASGANPAVLGNDLSPRHRLRARARLKMSGKIGDKFDWGREFDWGLRIATGSFADSISTNQTLTDFFNRKPFALDQAFVTYRPRSLRGRLRLQGGKFEAPWKLEIAPYKFEDAPHLVEKTPYKFESPWGASEMVFDNDLMLEGINESYTHTFPKGLLKELTFVAWQLPFLERNSAFVRNADGTVNVDQSRRGGRDLALYGGQVRVRLESNDKAARPKSCVKESDKLACQAKVAFSLSVADYYFSGTQFISPLQVFGSQIQLPLTITIPATATTPAQTVTTQVSIPRELLVAGNSNLGLTTASNNATNRDGRLASGYNLVDVLGRLDLNHSKRFPVTILLNFVTNTQTRDVVTVGPGGVDLILPNNENKGFWGEVQVGQPEERGDWGFGYTFMHIEKDAVLTPFNMSDITQQSDMRGHRFTFAYAADSKVTFSITGIVTERLNGLFGPFTATPPGSLNRATTRLQFDTVLKF